MTATLLVWTKFGVCAALIGFAGPAATNVASNLPWRFEPEQRSVTVHLGEQKMVFFTAENLSNVPIVGHATYNVTPDTSGPYFNKTSVLLLQ